MVPKPLHLLTFCLLMLASAAPPASAQQGEARRSALRSPELNLQYHRAETAWTTGGSLLEAKARVDRVLRELPDDRDALKLRAHVLLAMDREEEALADARRAVALDSTDAEGHLVLSEVALAAEDSALAADHLEAAGAWAPEDAALHLRLSWVAMQLRRLDAAEAYARVALQLDPRTAASHYQLARVFVLQDRSDDAVTVVARGLRTSLLDAGFVQRDPVLERLRRHPDLEPLLQ